MVTKTTEFYLRNVYGACSLLFPLEHPNEPCGGAPGYDVGRRLFWAKWQDDNKQLDNAFDWAHLLGIVIIITIIIVIIINI
jgi:hypothetical protein